MHIVLVHVKVRPEFREQFIEATLENACNSIQEPGIIRFDVLQDLEDPNYFILNEVYRTPDDQLKHRETNHYKKWKDLVAEMMAEPRKGVKFINLFPSDSEWK